MTTIPIFLSSTFRDFHRERDILVHEIAPRLDDALREFGCQVEMIDLRWGVGGDVMDHDDDVKHARVLSVCFDEIERARPLFVGLVGYRYGWVPPAAHASNAVSGRLTGNLGGMSATALEIEYGAFAKAAQSTQTAFFLRDIAGEPPVDFADADLEPINALRTRIGNSASANPHWSVSSYQLTARAGQIASYETFSNLAAQVLTDAVVARARSLPSRPTDPVDAAEQLFFESRIIVEGRESLIGQAGALLRSGTSVCLLGESGMGKSAIWCKVADLLGNDRRVLRAAVASSELLTSDSGVVRRLASQLGVHPPPFSDEHALLDWWRDQMRGRDEYVVAIDGIDSLDPGSARDDLGCVLGVPATHFVSTTDVAHAERLQANGFEIIEVGPLSPGATSEAANVLVRKLQRTLPSRAIELLADRPRSPLWLRLALGEVTSLGEEDFTSIGKVDDPLQAVGELVERTIAQLPVDLPNMIQRQISRVASRLGADATYAILCSLALSRSGLSPSDLTTSMGVSELDVAVVRHSFGGLICERGLDGRLGYAHSAVKMAIESSHPLSDDGYRQELHRRIAQALNSNALADRVRHADALWHALSNASGETAALAGDLMLFGLGAGPVDLPEYVIRVVASSLKVHGVRLDAVKSMSEKAVRGLARAMSRGALGTVRDPFTNELAVGLLERARKQIHNPVHNRSIADMALASTLRAAIQFNPDTVRSYIAELEDFLAASDSGHDEVYLAFSTAAHLIDPGDGRALITRAVVWAEHAVASPLGTRRTSDPADSSIHFSIDNSGWSNLCIALEAAYHLHVSIDAPRRILRYCELLLKAEPSSRPKARNHAAAKILAAAAQVVPDSSRAAAIVELEELLASQPEDQECIRLLDSARRSTGLASPDDRQLLMPLDNWPPTFTQDETVAHAIAREAVRISLSRIDRAETGEQLFQLSRRLCAVTKYSCEPDPGEVLTQSLHWLELAVSKDPRLVRTSALVDFNHLDSAAFATTAHLRTLARIVRTAGSGWVATLVLILGSVSRRLVQDRQLKDGAELLLEAADLIHAWEYSSQFEAARESSRQYGHNTRPTYCGQIAGDLRKVRDQLTWRHVKLMGHVTMAISDLDRIAASGNGT